MKLIIRLLSLGLLGLLLMFNSLVGGQVLIWGTALLLVIQGGIGIIMSFTNR